MITLDQLHAISGNTKYVQTKTIFIERLEKAAAAFPDFRKPHVIAQLLGQVCVESGYFRYTKEIWGPTKAQRRYEGRKDLGNIHPGDGKKYMGRGIIQCTGRSNYRALTAWLRRIISNCPDFEDKPEMLMHPRWLGWAVVWYWTTRVPQKYVDAGNNEMVTRRVNGGLNHFQERLEAYDRAGLVLLGRNPKDIRGFQRDFGLVVDGIPGPATRAALHKALVGVKPIGRTAAAGAGAGAVAAATAAVAAAVQYDVPMPVVVGAIAVIAGLVFMIMRGRK